MYNVNFVTNALSLIFCARITFFCAAIIFVFVQFSIFHVNNVIFLRGPVLEVYTYCAFLLVGLQKCMPKEIFTSISILSLSSCTTMETSSTILRSIEERIVVEENVISRDNSLVEKVNRRRIVMEENVIG